MTYIKPLSVMVYRSKFLFLQLMNLSNLMSLMKQLPVHTKCLNG